MVSQDTLQTRYRPNTWAGIIGQDHIVNILRGIVRNKAYTFTRSYILAGSPGGGKTTTLRVMANAIFCDNPQDGAPCLECQSCQEFSKQQYHDYVECDGAQYNKLEDIAKLIDIAKIYPIHSNKQRIILIDECQRLSNAAWDSLLKLLEDSKTRTIFMFATTEGDKIRPAIHSRSISLQVKPLSVSEIQGELTRICEAEGIEYDKASIAALAYAYNGKARDAIKALDMYHRSQGNLLNITLKSDNERFCEILKHIQLRKLDKALETLDTMSTMAGLGQILCDTLSALYCYPNNLICNIPELVLQNTKTLLAKSLRKTIDLYMQYKPETYEQVKLFLLVLGDTGTISSQTTLKSNTKRQLFRSQQKQESQPDDEL